MTKGFEGTALKSLGAQDYELTVVGVADTSPRTRRITLSAPALCADYEPKPTGWLRFWFLDPEQPEKRQQHGYTIIEADVQRGQFPSDFLLHQSTGPASTWALQNWQQRRVSTE